MARTTPTLTVVLARDALLSESAHRLFRHYMLPGETSSQQVLMRAARRHARSPEDIQRLYDAASQGQIAFPASALRSA